ncbi:hypothetical protein K435DRAFT_793588 [Dendrothele bispora CBS 962.96]|uniref:Uncharacterized protein n=1 Tax=Dendrothele bispora (strain CBS 962.96) TaxID=1314807 RepID=A0A4S8MEW5_DENBC|nr:hypothetical protein K435DRAFT_793588 [Dendrothele bispora CBS 962.96]
MGILTPGNDQATSPGNLTPNSLPTLSPALCPTSLPGIMNDDNQSSFPIGTHLFSEQTVQACLHAGTVENTVMRDAAEHVEMREMVEIAETLGNSHAKHVSGDHA